jgi:hypothetical protein
MRSSLGLAGLEVLVLAAGIPSAGAGDIVVLTAGKTYTGDFTGLERDRIFFLDSDDRAITFSPSEVFGIFAEAAARKPPRPEPGAKGELRVGATSLDGTILRYDPGSSFAIYAVNKQAKIALFRPGDRFRSLKPGPSLTLEEIDRGPAFGREALKSIKSLSKDNVLMGLSLAEEYLRLKPSGDEMLEVENLIASLRQGLKEKLKEWFQLGEVNIIYSKGGRTFLTYHFFSKMDSFNGLRCRVFVQMSDESLETASFIYYTTERSNRHHDSVEPVQKNSKVLHWRIVMEYGDVVAVEKESEPAGRDGWWKGQARELGFWGRWKEKNEKGAKSDKQKKPPDTYFSRTLGKKFDERRQDSIGSEPEKNEEEEGGEDEDQGE